MFRQTYYTEVCEKLDELKLLFNEEVRCTFIAEIDADKDRSVVITNSEYADLIKLLSSIQADEIEYPNDPN